MKKSIIFSISMLCMAGALQAQTVERRPHGVCVTPAEAELKSEVIFYTPAIARVVKYPRQIAETPRHDSYSVILQPQAVEVSYRENDTALFVTTAAMQLTIGKRSGNITFAAHDTGALLLREVSASCTVRGEGADAGALRVKQAFRLDKDEAIFGLGQRQSTKLNQRGEDVRIWSGNTNITIPYFTSAKGYGLYWDNAGDSRFRDTPEQTSFTSEVASCIDYYFFYKDGSQDGVVDCIRSLTGQATLFPLWTMGYWQCRERYKSPDELCDVLDKYRELQVPLDGIVQDWQYWGCDSNWNAMKFMNPRYINKMGDEAWMKYLPNAESREVSLQEPRIKSPEEMVRYVHDHNAHLMISIWASFGPWTDQYRELKALDALLPFETWPRKSGVRPYDPFNPKARDLYWRYLTHLYDMGFDAWWTDSTEPDHFEQPGDSDYRTHDGTWRSVKNAFPLVSNRGIYEHQRAMKGNRKRSVQMTRCGAFGLQHYGSFSWSGDVSSDWDVMKNQIPSGLNYVICGIPFWNTDIGGFFGGRFNNSPRNPAMQELQVRWMQWGCFMPLMRNHCSAPMIDEIYQFGKPGDWAYDVQKQYIELRYRLLPYIYSNAAEAALRSGTMMRPLVMDFAGDRRAIERADEYLFGRSILVKPVTDPLYTWRDERRNGHTIYPDVRLGAAPVQVYLPAGTQWYDFRTNALVEGGRELNYPCPIDVIPLFVRAGSILPFGPAVQYSNEKAWDNLEIRIYPGADATFVLYEDEGDSYDYERGLYTTITFRWDDARRELTIADRTGKYKGMLKSRSFNLVLVDGKTPAGDTAAEGVSVQYAGREVRVKL